MIAIVDHLLDAEGNLKLQKELFPKDGHSQNVFHFLKKNPHALNRFSLPLCDRKIEENILASLGQTGPITHRHLIWAILDSLLTPLRQTIGSCFATAPAILIQSEQMEQFLTDLQEILATGQMKRVIRGEEYSVPICRGPYPLLKIWEYTLASFSDVKTDFAKWNLYSSLGFSHEEENGVGKLIYHYLEDKLREANEKAAEFNQEYEIAFDQVRATERLLKNASTEHEARRLKAEHQSRVYHLHSCEEMRDKHHQSATNLSEFFSFLTENIIKNFQEFFQEVYDPELVGSITTEFEDSPAGFRLLYKHGRTHVGSWTLIHSEREYQDALANFFKAIEHNLIAECEWEGGHEEISHLTTHIVHLVKTEEFLEAALKRMSKIHKLQGQKPWAYISGGTLPTLIKTYFRRESDLTEESRWVDSPQDLLIFILETLKSLPPRIMDPMRRMLMTSPTHVFSLLPQLSPFRKGWEDPGFTYTWVRDRIILPARHFYEQIRLKPSEQISLMQELAKRLPPMEAYHLQQGFSVSDRDISLRAFADKVSLDSSDFLFEKFPPKNPLIFADTNWVVPYFAFIVNPISLKLDLWRINGPYGKPMREWGHFLDGSKKEHWTIYCNPYEYHC